MQDQRAGVDTPLPQAAHIAGPGRDLPLPGSLAGQRRPLPGKDLLDESLFGLTKSLAREVIFELGRAQRLAGDGIGLTVNAVAPGFIRTGMLDTIPDRVLDRLLTQIPVGRLGMPEEIARVVCFLAADAYITGQIWAVNGGLDM